MQRLLNIEEISELLGVTKSTIYSWTSQNRIPHVKLSKRVLKFREDEIMAWIEKRSVHFDSKNLKKFQSKSKIIKSSSTLKNEQIEKMIERAKKEVLCLK